MCIDKFGLLPLKLALLCMQSGKGLPFLHLFIGLTLWNSHPPRPPPGQEGHGSYVWILHDVPVKEHLDGNVFLEEEDNNRSMKTEEEYLDSYVTDKADFPEGGDTGEWGISGDERDALNECLIA